MKLWRQPQPSPTFLRNDRKNKRSKSIAKRANQAKLTFTPQVKVFEIPSRQSYSNLEKSRMWRGLTEIRMNARRNRAEIEWEGEDDWRNALEEDDMYKDEETGVIIHPCWVEDEESMFEVVSSDEEKEEEDMAAS